MLYEIIAALAGAGLLGYIIYLVMVTMFSGWE